MPKGQNLSAFLDQFLRRTNPVLFAGAGVGRRVGFPDWAGFIDHLAQASEGYEPESATLIRKRVAQGQFLAAASVFTSCDSIPLGERTRLLAAPFLERPSPDLLERLQPLVGLPFTAILTTNYESSLHSASSLERRTWVQPVELDDVSMRGAALLNDFFVGRIHGRAEQPPSMVVDYADYARVRGNPLYVEFLIEILKSRSCLFVGFSFVDPAIDHVLALYQERFGPTFPRMHAALVPSNASELSARLLSLNIEPVVYDPSDGHSELWHGFRDAFELLRKQQRIKRRTSIETPSSGTFHNYMAFAYAQVASSTDRQPITEMVQDGVVLSLIPNDETAISDQTLTSALGQTMHLAAAEAAELAGASLARLIQRGQAARTDAGLRKMAPPSASLVDRDLALLANAVRDRLLVRETLKLRDEEVSIICDTLEGLFIWRAWDLAAHFAGAGAGLATDLDRAVGDILAREAKGRPLRAPSAVKAAIIDLLTAPEDRETAPLAALGRTAFGLQLVLSSPRQALLQSYALPQRIYLDSNVVMPAITEGHPLRPIYAESISRLAEASKTHGIPLRVVVGQQFLNEVVSHRRAAIEIVRELQLEDPETLRGHILFYSSTNTNVFIGAYGAWVGREGAPLSFADFLKKVAPYDSEEALARHLRTLGIQSTEMRFGDQHNTKFVTILSALVSGYERTLAPDEPLKGKILIEHEAQQLTQLSLDIDSNVRSLFITADGRLRRIMSQEPTFRALAGSTMTVQGLVALVDVMVGLEVDTRSLVRLLWASPQSDDENALFNYFVRLALRKYDEAIAMEMEDAARAVAKEAQAAAVEERVNLFGRSQADVAKAAKFMDRYEDKFFERMKEAIERRETD